jgi:hypothetical protein
MPKATETVEAELFEQVEDEHGRTRLDRPFTAEEARVQDEQNMTRYFAERATRFGPRQVRNPTPERG